MTEKTVSSSQLQTVGVADVRDMAIVHQYYRREFTLAPQIVRDLDPADNRRRQAAQEWFAGTLLAMHHHHIAEDELMYPLMQGHTPQELLDLMEVQHQAVDRGVRAVEAKLAAWIADEPESAENLAQAFDELRPVLIKHLDDEERLIVPLIAESVTAEDYRLMGTSGNDRYEPHYLMMSFGAMIEQCSAQDADFMLSHLTPEVRNSWYDHVGGEYRALMALLRGPLRPPEPSMEAESMSIDSPVIPAHARPAQFVLRTDDPAQAADFYGALFGWKFDAEAGFSLADRLVARTRPGSGGWLPYLTVTDLDSVLAAAVAAGAASVGESEAVGGTAGIGAVVTAPGGAALGLWQAGSGSAVEITSAPGAVVWIEEKTHEQAADTAFLSTLFGFEVLGPQGPGAVRVLKGDGPLFGGVMQFDGRWAPDEKPHWLLYLEVEDLQDCVARAAETGGSVWFPPFDTPLGRMAYLRDPAGNAFAVVTVSEQGRSIIGRAA